VIAIKSDSKVGKNVDSETVIIIIREKNIVVATMLGGVLLYGRKNVRK
jgi:hypothetical protein